MGFNSGFKMLTDTILVTLRSTIYVLPDDGLNRNRNMSEQLLYISM